MANRFLGETLTRLGPQIPAMIQSNRLYDAAEEERRRKRELEDLTLDRSTTTWNQEQQDRQRKLGMMGLAEGALVDYESSVSAQTPLPEGLEGPVRPQRSRFELGMEAGLPRYQEVSPEAKGLWGAIEKEEKGIKSAEELEQKLEAKTSDLEKRLQSAEEIARNKGLSARDIAILKMAFQGEQKELDRQSKEDIQDNKTKADNAKAEELKLDIKSQLEKVMNHKGKYSGVDIGQIASFAPTESRDFKKQFEKLKSMMTLENLKYLKGAMSDKDVAFIQSASTALDLGASPEAFDRELNSLYSKFITTGQDDAKYKFNSVEEAEAANLEKGTVIYINGRKAIVE